MIIFPLSWGGKIALIMIAVILGIICFRMYFPDKWIKWFGKKDKKEEDTGN